MEKKIRKVNKNRNTKKDYVNNKEFFEMIVNYKDKKKINPDTRIPSKIGTILLQIATRYATKGQFNGYTFKEDMIMDAVENMVRYFDNFDETKYNNCLAYYTQITHFAFLRRISREKQQMYTKYKLFDKNQIFKEGIQGQSGDESDIDVDVGADFQSHMNNFISDFEASMEKKKQKKEA